MFLCNQSLLHRKSTEELQDGFSEVLEIRGTVLLASTGQVEVAVQRSVRRSVKIVTRRNRSELYILLIVG